MMAAISAVRTRIVIAESLVRWTRISRRGGSGEVKWPTNAYDAREPRGVDVMGDPKIRQAGAPVAVCG